MTTEHSAPQVLVVEDEALLLFSIADDLRDAGFIVLEAANAEAAMGILQANANIRLLFTDIDMPGAMDGLQLSALVRDRWPPIRIIVTSGKHRPDASRLPTDGMFIAKPYTPTGVAAAISAMLG